MKINRLWAGAHNFLSLNKSLTVFCALLCASLITLPAAAQTPPTPQQQPTQTTPSAQPQQPEMNPQDIVSRPIPARTIGLDPGKVVKWSLRDAIMAALDKNVDIDLQRENVRLMQYDLISYQGVYDPVTTSRILYNKSTSPNAFRFSGTDANSVTSDTLTYNFGATKNFERWGSFATANFNNQRSVTNTNNLTTQYSPSLNFTFTQPLFKNFKTDANRHLIQVTKKRLDLTDAQFRQRVIEIISQVQQAYWDLSLAIHTEDVARDSVKLAETQLNNNKRQVEVGTLAPIEIVSAATQLESRRQQVFQAMNQVGIAENTLKQYVANGPKDDIWTSQIDPVEPFEIKAISIPVSEALDVALKNRPEVRQQALQKEINKIDVDFFRNQAKPQIDLIASYSTNGIGGTPLIPGNVTGNCNNPVNDANGKPVCLGVAPVLQGTTYIPGVTTTPFVQSSFINPDFVGGYGTALGNLFKNEFRTWTVGIQFNFPLRNRTAKANLGKALETDRQIELQTRQIMQGIEVEVRNAVQTVELTTMRIEAAKAATEYARQQLVGEEKKFAAGLSTTFFILDRQNQLTQAQLTELQARADYNKAVAQLQRVMSTTLSSNSLEIKEDTPVTIK
jgi:HAE1 family hydrophobic/amphiphilic exporter-1